MSVLIALIVDHLLILSPSPAAAMLGYPLIPLLSIAAVLVSLQGADCTMTFYALAVGQGDSSIIQCPNGKDILILDMGASPPRFDSKDYVNSILKNKFGAAQSGKNIHILISHSHTDHYDYFNGVLDSDLLANVRIFIMGGNYSGYNVNFRKWLEANLDDRMYMINDQGKCFGNSNCSLTKPPTGKVANLRSKRSILAGKVSDPWQFCPSSDVKFTVLGANIGTNPNGESVILKIQYKSWSMLMSGDFENATPQKELMNFYTDSSIFKSNYYKVAHHGAWTDKKPNTPALLDLIQPARVYISQGYPSLSKFHHPNSVTIDHLRNLTSIVSIDPTTNAPFVYWVDDGKKKGVVTMKGMDRAIYETCRSIVSKKEVCEDIHITSNGQTDTTEYVSVPSVYYRTVA